MNSAFEMCSSHERLDWEKAFFDILEKMTSKDYEEIFQPLSQYEKALLSVENVNKTPSSLDEISTPKGEMPHEQN